jgi:hypothetical protein
MGVMLIYLLKGVVLVKPVIKGVWGTGQYGVITTVRLILIAEELQAPVYISTIKPEMEKITLVETK